MARRRGASSDGGGCPEPRPCAAAGSRTAPRAARCPPERAAATRAPCPPLPYGFPGHGGVRCHAAAGCGAPRFLLAALIHRRRWVSWAGLYPVSAGLWRAARVGRPGRGWGGGGGFHVSVLLKGLCKVLSPGKRAALFPFSSGALMRAAEYVRAARMCAGPSQEPG